jgi:hypothetical protein
MATAANQFLLQLVATIEFSGLLATCLGAKFRVQLRSWASSLQRVAPTVAGAVKAGALHLLLRGRLMFQWSKLDWNIAVIDPLQVVAFQ